MASTYLLDVGFVMTNRRLALLNTLVSPPNLRKDGPVGYLGHGFRLLKYEVDRSHGYGARAGSNFTIL